MSDLIYRQAVTVDGEPVAVTEEVFVCRYPHRSEEIEFVGDTYGLVHFRTHIRPCSWALILPGDTVQCYGDTRVVECVGVDYIELAVGLVVAPEDLTLVCGEPSELRRQNPAWRWD